MCLLGKEDNELKDLLGSSTTREIYLASTTLEAASVRESAGRLSFSKLTLT